MSGVQAPRCTKVPAVWCDFTQDESVTSAWALVILLACPPLADSKHDACCQHRTYDMLTKETILGLLGTLCIFCHPVVTEQSGPFVCRNI